MPTRCFQISAGGDGVGKEKAIANGCPVSADFCSHSSHSVQVWGQWVRVRGVGELGSWGVGALVEDVEGFGGGLGRNRGGAGVEVEEADFVAAVIAVEVEFDDGVTGCFGEFVLVVAPPSARKSAGTGAIAYLKVGFDIA